MKSDHKLRLVFWESTVACNLRCRHCRRLEEAATAAPDELSTAEARDLIEQLVDAGAKILILSGGEPLLRADIFELASCAHQQGLMVALATNGTLIDAEVAQRIRETGIKRVSISLDGADARTHNEFRDQAGSFEKAINGLGLVREQGVETQINVTIARHNFHQLDEIYQLAIEQKVKALHLFFLVPVGCGEEIEEEYQLTPQEYEELLVSFFELRRKSSIELRATCAPQFMRILEEREGQLTPEERNKFPELTRQTRGCLAGWSVVFVAHNGEVFPCGYFPLSAGNIRKKSLKELWEKAEPFLSLRNLELLEGNCGHCHYQAICGGCRARALASFGEYLAGEPLCLF